MRHFLFFKRSRLWLVTLTLMAGFPFTFPAYADCPEGNVPCELWSKSIHSKKLTHLRGAPEPMLSMQSNLPAMAILLPQQDYPVFAVGMLHEATLHGTRLKADGGREAIAKSDIVLNITQLYLLTPEKVVRLSDNQYIQSGTLMPTSKADEGMPLRPVRITQRMRATNAHAKPVLNLNIGPQNGQWLFPVMVLDRVQNHTYAYAWQPGTFALPVLFSDPGPKGNAIQMLVDQYQDPNGDPSEGSSIPLGEQPPILTPLPLHAALEQLRVLYFKGQSQAAFAASLTGEATAHRMITNEWLNQSLKIKP